MTNWSKKKMAHYSSVTCYDHGDITRVTCYLLFAVASVVGMTMVVAHKESTFCSVERVWFQCRMIATKVLNKANNRHFECKVTDENDAKKEDDVYLKLCHHIRLSIMDKPRQSLFRVVCVLVVVDDNQNVITWIAGTNDEPSSFIGNSICDEQAAFLQYRLFRIEHDIHASEAPMYIKSIYIVSDCVDKAIPPGMLCRKYMLGYQDSVRPKQHRSFYNQLMTHQMTQIRVCADICVADYTP
jgi:hypothetical protein